MQRNFARNALRSALLAGAAAASAAPAQVPHPIPPQSRPLYQRAMEAELIAVARVVRVDAGRLEVAAEAALRGAPPARFEVKRSPLRPPRLALGDRALLFLRGDRAPYVLAGRPEEVVGLAEVADSRELAMREALAGQQSVPALAAFWLARLEKEPPGDAVRELAAAELSGLCASEREATLAAILPVGGAAPSRGQLLVAVQACGSGSGVPPIPSASSEAGPHAIAPATLRIATPGATTPTR
jgi:hypothetical protein